MKTMKPSALRIERLLAKVEAEVVPPPRRRYVFYDDEVAEAEAQGLPYVLAPRVLSLREWERKYGQNPSLPPAANEIPHLSNAPCTCSDCRAMRSRSDPSEGPDFGG
jgi:hypothetical protein